VLPYERLLGSGMTFGRRILSLVPTVGLLMMCATGISRGQAIQVFAVPTANSDPNSITAGPDGNLWFTEQAGGKVGKITTAGVITEFPIPTPASSPNGIATGPDGNLWFTEGFPSKIGRITPAGAITEFSIPTNSGPNAIVAGADGNLWFTEFSNKIGRMTTTGVFTEFPIPIDNCYPQSIAVGPNGNLWFVESSQLQGANINYIVEVTPEGLMHAFPVPLASDQFTNGIAAGGGNYLWFTEVGTGVVGRMNSFGAFVRFSATPFSGPWVIADGPDGNMWFTEINGGRIGRITPSGSITEVALASDIDEPGGIVAGPDGNLWFTERNANQIGRIAPGQVVGAVAVPAMSPAMFMVLAVGLASAAMYVIGRR
jgi:streptogramin lyase